MNKDPTTMIGEVRRGRGRPRDLAKREMILDAATALFYERGMAATTMEAVAERAAVSKMTVYSHFPDKAALLKASFERNISAIRFPELTDKADLPTSVEALNAFGERLVSFLNRPEIVKAGDLMAVTAADHPSLAAAFYAAGPEAVAAMVVKFLRSLDARRLISVGDVDLVAEQLISAWLGVSQLKQSLGVAGPPSTEEISRNVRHATQIFVRSWSTAAGTRRAPGGGGHGA